MVKILFLCFAVPFCIFSGASVAILVGMWVEKKLITAHKTGKEGE